MMLNGFLRPILAGVVAMVLAVNGVARQDCGESVFGGTIGSGNYAGAGATCRAALTALHLNMLAVAPTCPGCTSPEVGCTGSVLLSDSVVVSNCIGPDPMTGLYSYTATTTGGTWDAVCSSCH